MPRMLSTQQANRRHEDKLKQLEDQLSAERVRVHNRLWEDTQRLQKDLIQLRIRTPSTTTTTTSRTGKQPLFCARPSRASRVKMGVESSSRAVVRGDDTGGGGGGGGEFVSGSGVRAQCVGGKEVQSVGDKEVQSVGKEVHGKEVYGTEVHGKEVHGKEVQSVGGKEVHGKEVQSVGGKEVQSVGGKEVHGKEVHGKEVHGKEVHGKEVQSVGAKEVQSVGGKEVHGKEVHGKEVQSVGDKEVPEPFHEKDGGKQIQVLCTDDTDVTQCVVTVSEQTHPDCVDNLLVYLSDQHEEQNVDDHKPENSDVGSKSKKEEGSETIPASILGGRRVKDTPGMGLDRKKTWPLMNHKPPTLRQTSVTEKKNVQGESHQESSTETTVSNEVLHPGKNTDLPGEVQVEVTDTSGKRSILSRLNTMYHIGSVSHFRFPGVSDHNPQNTAHDKEETYLKISDLLAPVNRRISYVTDDEQHCQQTQAQGSHSTDLQQTALQIRRETVRRHQQSVLPTVQVHGDNVRYFYQGLPGQVKTFTPDSRTQTLLRRNSQIGSNLQHLYQKKSNHRNSFLPKEHPDHICDDDDDDPQSLENDEVKNQLETLLQGWSQAAAERRKALLHKQRKAKMRSLLLMKPSQNLKSPTVSDLEDEALSGWRLLKLYRLWSNNADRPVWASSSYLRRKHQENEHHQHRQQRHAATDVQTRVLEAMSAGVCRKSHPDTGLRAKSAAKPWLRKTKHAKPKLSGFSPQHLSSNKTCCVLDQVDPATQSETNPEFRHEQGSVRGGTKGIGPRGTKRVSGSEKKRPGVRDCEYRGRRVVLGMEHRMWVGNLSLSTGLTGTVATSRRHPDVLVRKEH